jgi:hypothetical protein
MLPLAAVHFSFFLRRSFENISWKSQIQITLLELIGLHQKLFNLYKTRTVTKFFYSYNVRTKIKSDYHKKIFQAV